MTTFFGPRHRRVPGRPRTLPVVRVSPQPEQMRLFGPLR